MKRKKWIVYALVAIVSGIGLLALEAGSVRGKEIVDSAALVDWTPVPENGIISEPGKYFLKKDLLVDRRIGIEIQADDVTLDLRGRTLRFTDLPREGAYGIVANNRTGITIYGGVVGGFWFNIHCTQNHGLRIHDVRFDDIPYLAVNVAQSKDVVISDNEFKNFRYDLEKAEDSTYVIGINIGAEDVIIANNRFDAKPDVASAQGVEVETVFVLFSANVSTRCLVAQNDMRASEILPRSYGIWVATGAEATIAYNLVRNMKYGVCLASDATALVCSNRFAADQPTAMPAIETFGINAPGAKEVLDVKNAFEGMSTPTALPAGTDAQETRGG